MKAIVTLLVVCVILAAVFGEENQEFEVVYGSCPMELRRSPTDPSIFPPGSFTESCSRCSYQELKRILFCEDCLLDPENPNSMTLRSWLKMPPRDEECYVVNSYGKLKCTKIPKERRAEVEQKLKEDAEREQELKKAMERKKKIGRGQSGPFGSGKAPQFPTKKAKTVKDEL